MTETVDARGMACPQPVMATRRALETGGGPLRVLVDNPTARDNVARFARSRGCEVTVAEEDFGFTLDIVPGEYGSAASAAGMTASSGEAGGSHLFVLSSDFMGKVDNELGRVLIKAFLNTLADRDRLPSHLILFNTGVALACGEAETVTALRRLEELGVTVLACGTCLDYLGLKEGLRAGTVSNMYEIIEALSSAGKCITV